MTESPLIASLTAALAARPDDLPLRLHLAGLLLEHGRSTEAIAHAAHALQQEPGNPEAQRLMQRALDAPPTPTDTTPAGTTSAGAGPGEATPEEEAAPGAGPDGINWTAYEQEFSGVIPPRFAKAGDEPDPVEGQADRIFDVEVSTVRLADVGGMTEVKRRLELAFLGPLRNPGLRKLYGKSLRGGLMLYGPPGCGKTFLARAIAGEMAAKFLSLSIVDVLDMWIGNSERNLHELFQAARRHAPCVLFLDEVDALGHKRSQLGTSAMRTLGNQLLAELDGMEGTNEGVFVLAATNAPVGRGPGAAPAGAAGPGGAGAAAGRRGAGGDPGAPPAGPAHRQRRPAPAGRGHRGLLRRGPRAPVRDGGRVRAARLDQPR